MLKTIHHAFIYTILFVFLFVANTKNIHASEPVSLYENNLFLQSKLSAQKNAITKKQIQKPKKEKKYFFEKLNFSALDFFNLEEKFSKYKSKYQEKSAKKFRKKGIRKQKEVWWGLLDLMFQSPEFFLFFLVSLVISLGIWFLFVALGTTIGFEVAFIIGLVITLIGCIFLLWR